MNDLIVYLANDLVLAVIQLSGVEDERHLSDTVTEGICDFYPAFPIC